jgi:outer membrane biosynthesis protein TonB
LRQVAEQISKDPFLNGLIATDEVASQCRSTAESVPDDRIVAASRQVATQLARRASSLAAGIQQKSAPGAPTPTGTVSAPQAAVPPPPQAPAPTPATIPVPCPSPAKEPPAKQLPAKEPAAKVPARETPTPVTPPKPAAAPPKPDVSRLARITAAVSDSEREAVAVALKQDRRFAVVAEGVFIDLRHNRMWCRLSDRPGRQPEAARLATACQCEGYTDWRLPQPGEVQALLGASGSVELQTLSLVPSGLTHLWTSSTRSRFFGLLKDATAVPLAGGLPEQRSFGAAGVGALATR